MRRGVIALGVTSPIARDARARFSQRHLARHFAEGGDPSIDAPDFVDVDAPAFAGYLAAVGDLSAGFGVKRRLAQHYGDASVGEVALGDDIGIDLEGVVAREGYSWRRVEPITGAWWSCQTRYLRSCRDIQNPADRRPNGADDPF